MIISIILAAIGLFILAGFAIVAALCGAYAHDDGDNSPNNLDD